MNFGKIILDNGGGITLQMGEWAHYYQDGASAAEDLAAWLANPDTSDWEGHEEEAASLEPTQDEIRNGGYRVIRLDRGVDTLASLAGEVAPTGWGNSNDLSAALAAMAA